MNTVSPLWVWSKIFSLSVISFLSESFIWEFKHSEHLVCSVVYSAAVFIGKFLFIEVRGQNRKEMIVISRIYQLLDGRVQVSVLKDFKRLRSYIVDGYNVLFAYDIELCFVLSECVYYLGCRINR